MPNMGSDLDPRYRRTTTLVDVLDRVLDKGLVVAGDIRVSLADVELLTIRIRLLICSVDKAQEIGLDWWKHDPYLTTRAPLTEENRALREQVRLLEQRLERIEGGGALTGRSGAPVAEERGGGEPNGS